MPVLAILVSMVLPAKTSMMTQQNQNINAIVLQVETQSVFDLFLLCLQNPLTNCDTA